MADDERVIRLFADALASRAGGRSVPELLCRRAMDDLQMDGVAVTVLSTPEHRHVVFASGSDVLDVEDVQFTLGDGPVIEAYRDRRAVLVPDLLHEPVGRWLLFGEAAARTPGYAGVFAFPLVAGDGGPVGVLALYRRLPGQMGPAAVGEAHVLAGALAMAMVRRTSEAAVEAEGLDDPEAAADSVGALGDEESPDRWSDAEQVVYQAVGMVVARHRLTPYEALARLRAHAFAHDTTLDEVALTVVERRLRLED